MPTNSKARQSLYPRVAEWMGMERLCCPFLTLQLSAAGSQPVWLLSLTGPSGVKALFARCLRGQTRPKFRIFTKRVKHNQRDAFMVYLHSNQRPPSKRYVMLNRRERRMDRIGWDNRGRTQVPVEGGVNITRFTYPLAHATSQEVTDALNTIAEHATPRRMLLNIAGISPTKRLAPIAAALRARYRTPQLWSDTRRCNTSTLCIDN